MSVNDVAKSLDDLVRVEVFNFASFIAGRTNGTGSGTTGDDFKRHRTLGQARAAISAYRSNVHGGRANLNVAVYAWDVGTGTWVAVQ
jgi:hypothetical protein